MHQGNMRRAKGSSTSPDVRSHRKSDQLLSREGKERSGFFGKWDSTLIARKLPRRSEKFALGAISAVDRANTYLFAFALYLKGSSLN